MAEDRYFQGEELIKYEDRLKTLEECINNLEIAFKNQSQEIVELRSEVKFITGNAVGKFGTGISLQDLWDERTFGKKYIEPTVKECDCGKDEICYKCGKPFVNQDKIEEIISEFNDLFPFYFDITKGDKYFQLESWLRDKLKKM